MEKITIENMEKLKEKLVAWAAPGAEENGSYCGVDRVLDIVEGRNPLKTESVIGDNLSYAFIDPIPSGHEVCYSDSGRYIEVREIDEDDSLVQFCINEGFYYFIEKAKLPHRLKPNTDIDFLRAKYPHLKFIKETIGEHFNLTVTK